MKILQKIFIILVACSFGLSATAQKVASDRNLNVDFDDYETFTWSSHAANEQDVYFLSDALLKQQMREAIKYELEARGFEKTESDADLVVNFRVFEEPVTFQGYEATYVDENYWAPNEIRKEAIGLIPEAEIREWEDREEYYLKPGSMLIQLVDKNSGQIVWQGYSTDMMKEEKESEEGNVDDKEYTENNLDLMKVDGNVKKTIQNIFEEEFDMND